MASVLQSWVQELPFMQQSVLLSAIRGPDGFASENSVKPIIRWLRRCILISSLDQEVLSTPYDPRGGKFTGPSYSIEEEMMNAYDEYYIRCVKQNEVPDSVSVFTEKNKKDNQDSWLPVMIRYMVKFMNDVDGYPHHYVQHLKDAAQVIGYKHPEEEVRTYWNVFYQSYCKAIAVLPESVEQMDERLDDFRKKKKANNEPTPSQ